MQVESEKELSKVQQWFFVVRDYAVIFSVRSWPIEILEHIPHAARAFRPGYTQIPWVVPSWEEVCCVLNIVSLRRTALLQVLEEERLVDDLSVFVQKCNAFQ